MLSPAQVIVVATPVFLALIAIEIWADRRRGRNTYRLNDALTSISLGMLSQVSGVFTGLLRIGIYSAVFASVSLMPKTDFWTSAPGWLLALVFYDFCYYWNHRLGHTCAVFWAAHVVHHQSEDYNLSTALRQSGSGALLGWVFYLPMALAGVPPLVFAVVGLIDLLYQFWIHTQQIGSLGRFDRLFASPSNHRVHHAVNDRYIDKNYGGVFMVWDHLFGSFEDEDPQEPCVYGTRSPLHSWDPLWANLEVYVALWKESRAARRWRDKLGVWIRPPGWQSTDKVAHSAKAQFDWRHLSLYAPPMSPGVQRLALVQFLALLTGSGVFLWFTDGWPAWQSGVWFAVLVSGMWSLGAMMQGRIGASEALVVGCAALATATAATDLTEWHRLFKPLTLVLAIVAVALVALGHVPARPLVRLPPRRAAWLSAALVGSLIGDVCLMFEGLFIPGLAAFLLSHLAYTALFHQDTPWRAARRAGTGLALVGLVFYAALWMNGLPTGLRLPVAAYVMAIVLMVSMAIGRAAVLRSGSARLVATGAVFFMLSDATLAINRFVSPIPHEAFWVLGTYYAAQCLIVMGMLRAGSKPTPR